MSPYFALYTVENNKNKKSVKFQGDMLKFCDFIQVFVFTRNHHLNWKRSTNMGYRVTDIDFVEVRQILHVGLS